MSKILKAVLPEKCLGCEMCVYEAQRQMNKLGLEGSFIRIFKEMVGFDSFRSTGKHIGCRKDQKHLSSRFVRSFGR